MNNVGNKLFPVVEQMLDWTAKRQQAISANLANIDTPGYKAKDITFSKHMESLGLETTSATHLENEIAKGMDVFEVGTKAKDNGNTVDLDREMTELTKNGLQYVALIQYMNQKLRTLRTAIKDGGAI
jgi:flagellar basal-body rod protein FlgB